MHEVENINAGIAYVFIYGGTAAVAALVLALAYRAWRERRRDRDR